MTPVIGKAIDITGNWVGKCTKEKNIKFYKKS